MNQRAIALTGALLISAATLAACGDDNDAYDECVEKAWKLSAYAELKIAEMGAQNKYEDGGYTDEEYDERMAYLRQQQADAIDSYISEYCEPYL